MTLATPRLAPATAGLHHLSPTEQRARQGTSRDAVDGAVPAGVLKAPSATARNVERNGLAPPAPAEVWCEALVTFEDSTGTEQRAARRWDTYAAPSPRAAIGWIRSSVQTVTPTLGRLQRGYVLDHWVHGPASLEDFARLRRGRPCLLTVYRERAAITWRARPVRFLPTAAVNGRPPCTGPRRRARTEVSHAR